MLVDAMFLGEPPANMKQWIIDHYGEQKSEWDKLVDKLEAFDMTLTP